MDVLEAVNLLISSGTLAAVLRLVWMLSRHDTLHEQHSKNINELFKRVRHLEAK